MEVQRDSFLTSVLAEGERSVSRYDRFNLGHESPNRGPLGCVLRPEATFANYACIIKNYTTI
jgi:hypothetical protein